MLKRILIALVLLVVIVLGYAATKPDSFHFERTAVIATTPEKLYPYLTDLKLGGQWNPYEQKDPSMKKTFSGAESGTGAVMDFEGNGDVGAGQLEVVQATPSSQVDLKLRMRKPFEGEQDIHYKISPDEGGTRFTWAMSGRQSFFMKLISVFIDCEKMFTNEMDKGIANLQAIFPGDKR
ncbi:MAG: SRPBCC family protein [Bdellovibrionaceae bacterium]|nr:SRPBCC family protein [Pseudobdellovibrionaceae bacterium]